MPMYFFHLLKDGHRIEDTEGKAFRDADEAWEAARAAALDLMQSGIDELSVLFGSHFEVTDETNRILFELPFAEAVELPRRPH